MNAAQERFGEPLEFVTRKVQPVMNGMIQDFVRESPFVVLATSNAEGDCDCSPKGGRPGFVRVVDRAGLLFLIPGCDWTVRVNGRVSRLDGEGGKLQGVAPEVFDPDDNTKVLQGILLEVEEAYGHCPRAFTFSKLWDTERIEKARAADANGYWFKRWRAEMD